MKSLKKIIHQPITLPSYEVTIPYPDNITEENKKYFKPTEKGIVKECYILESENVYANRELVLWKNGKMLPQAFAHDWIIEKTYGSLKNKSKFIIKNYIRRTKKIKEPVLWCIDPYTTGGFYHWIAEVLPRVRVVKDYLDKFIVAIPDYFFEKWHFIKEFFKLLRVKNFVIIKNEYKYLIEHLVLPTRPGDYFFRQDLPLREGVKWLQHLALKESKNIKFRRIYISRAKAKYRKVINEDQIIEILKKYDFEILNFEDYSLQEQIQLCSNAEVLMSIHGAGLINMVFMPKGSKVIEIRPDNVYFILNCFHTLAVHFPVSYNFILCEYSKEKLPNDKRLEDHSLFINAESLDQQLSIILD